LALTWLPFAIGDQTRTAPATDRPNLFLVRFVKIGDREGIIAFENDVSVGGKRRGGKAGASDSKRNDSFHVTRVMKKVAATAATRTIR